MITKLGKELLHDHQERVLAKLRDENIPGLIAWHSTGSGKTLTALKAMQEASERTGKPSLFITPASIVENARKEIANYTLPLGPKNLRIMSYEKASRDVDDLGKNEYGMVAFDEAHRLRNPDTARVRNLSRLVGRADKTLLLTGTAGYNNPSDIPALAKLINPKIDVPASAAEFERTYIDVAGGGLKNAGKLKNKLAPYVDIYQRAEDAADFPSVERKIMRVPMSAKQEKLYNYLIRKLPPHLRKSVSNNLPLNAKDVINLNAFSTGIRQASDSTMHHDVTGQPEDSPKLVAAVESMVQAAKAPRFRGVAYSNYLDAGITPYASLLRKKGIEPMIFTGGMSARAKKALVDEYNSKDTKPKVLLVSSSGGEGLDLKGTRRLQVLEPHFNQAKIDQVTGRGARFRSHTHLPESERNLVIEEYRSTLPGHWYNRLGIGGGMAIDDYLAQASERKNKIISDIRDTLDGRHI